MIEKDIFNAIQYKFLTEKLEQLGIGDKTKDIYSIFKKTLTILPGINVLPDDLLVYIWSFLSSENDDIKIRCTLQSCCKRWKNILLSQKNVYMNSLDIYNTVMPDSLLKKIYGDTERLVLNLNFKPRCFKSQWILSLISEFKKLQELVLIAWFGFKENDIFRLTRCVSLHSLKIIAGNNGMTIFYMDRHNEDSLSLDRVKIGYMNALNPSESYKHLNVLYCDNISWNYDLDRWNWFHGELYIDPFTLNKFSYLKWFDLCHKLHIVDNYCRYNHNFYDDERTTNKSVISYTNKSYFSDECSSVFEHDYLYNLSHLYPHCKVFKISNWKKGDDIRLYSKNYKNIDLITIHSKYSLRVSNYIINDENNVWAKKYQLQAENIIFHDMDDHKKFIVEKKIKDNKLVFLQIER